MSNSELDGLRKLAGRAHAGGWFDRYTEERRAMLEAGCGGFERAPRSEAWVEMGDIERKIAVIDAAAAWAEAIQTHGVEAARPFRANFEMALDDALTAANRGAVEESRMSEGWAIRRRNGGIDANDALMADGSLFGDDYGEWIPVVRADVSTPCESCDGSGKFYPRDVIEAEGGHDPDCVACDGTGRARAFGDEKEGRMTPGLQESATQPPVFVSGGKRLNFSRRDEYDDSSHEDFQGFGKDTGCYPSCSWEELCAMAKLIVEHPAFRLPETTGYYPPTIEGESERRNPGLMSAWKFVAMRVCSTCKCSLPYPETDEGWEAVDGLWRCPTCSGEKP